MLALPCSLLAGVAAKGLLVSRLAGWVYRIKDAGAGVNAGVSAAAADAEGAGVLATFTFAGVGEAAADGAAGNGVDTLAATDTGVNSGLALEAASWEVGGCWTLFAAAVRGVKGIALGAASASCASCSCLYSSTMACTAFYSFISFSHETCLPPGMHRHLQVANLQAHTAHSNICRPVLLRSQCRLYKLNIT